MKKHIVLTAILFALPFFGSFAQINDNNATVNQNLPVRFESSNDHRYVYLDNVSYVKIFINGGLYKASQVQFLSELNTAELFNNTSTIAEKNVEVVFTYKNGAERIARWQLKPQPSGTYVANK